MRAAKLCIFAITLASPGSLVGAVELRAIDTEHSHAKLSLGGGKKQR
jgi:hypothetical protein